MQVLPNQLIELHLESTSGLQIFRTRVEDVYEDLLIIGAPLRQGHLVPIRVGTKLVVQFKLQGSVQEGRFTSMAIVEKRFTANVPLIQLRLLGTWEKTQERSFVRVPVFVDTVFVPLPNKGEENQEEGPLQTGIMLNLSGGGFMLRTAYDFSDDEEIRISFELAGMPITAWARLARIISNKDERPDFGFSFLELTDSVREHIIRYVFKRQIDQAK